MTTNSTPDAPQPQPEPEWLPDYMYGITLVAGVDFKSDALDFVSVSPNDPEPREVHFGCYIDNKAWAKRFKMSEEELYSFLRWNRDVISAWFQRYYNGLEFGFWEERFCVVKDVTGIYRDGDFPSDPETYVARFNRDSALLQFHRDTQGLNGAYRKQAMWTKLRAFMADAAEKGLTEEEDFYDDDDE